MIGAFLGELACRIFTVLSTNPYRSISNHASFTSNENTEVQVSTIGGLKRRTLQQREDDQVFNVKKWARMWRSITISSLGLSFFPYCLYIRILDLHDLGELLDEHIFKNVASEDFFEGGMQDFRVSLELEHHSKPRLDRISVVNAIGSSITKYVGDVALRDQNIAALREISGNALQEPLSTWAWRLPRLESLRLWDGTALGESLAKAISATCPRFTSVRIYMAMSPEVDHQMGLFFSNLKPNSLQVFEILNRCQLGYKTLTALTSHNQSLQILDLGDLRTETILQLPLLKSCTAFRRLKLQDVERRVDLKAEANGVFLDIVEWLQNCSSLVDLTIRGFLSAPAILEAVLPGEHFQLRRLEVRGYVLASSAGFHLALHQQPSLEVLELNADPEESGRDDKDTLITAIATLEKLRWLSLVEISAYFDDGNVIKLVSRLPGVSTFRFHHRVHHHNPR